MSDELFKTQMIKYPNDSAHKFLRRIGLSAGPGNYARYYKIKNQLKNTS